MRKLTTLLVLMLCLGMTLVDAQTRKVTGKVSSVDDGQGIPGVSVSVKGTTLGTITNIEGTYSLNVPSDATHLIFSFVGMATQEVAVAGKSKINVIMKSDAIDVDEVVVTAMGIKKSSKAITYGISKVDGEKTAQKAEPDLLKALQGKVAGVNITGASSVPGGASRITIRGNSSFKGNNQPLIIVDGIPYSNKQINGSNQLVGGGSYQSGLATIDPNNIESMSVLKGAAACTFYGSRAANGVILITTKTGSSNAVNKGLEVSINSSYTVEKIASLPDYQNTYGSGGDFVGNGYFGSWGTRTELLDELSFTDAWHNAYPLDYPTTMMPYVTYPDNVESLFRTGSIFDNSITVRSGNETTNFSATASDLKQKSFIPFSDYNKSALSLGGNTKLQNGLKIGGTFSYTTSEQNGPVMGDLGSFSRALFMGRSWNMDLPYEGPNGENLFYKPEDHPMWSWKHNKVIEEVDRMTASLNASYDVTDWFGLTYRYGVNVLNNKRTQITDVGSNLRDDKQGEMLIKDAKITEKESVLMANLRKSLTEDLNIRGTLGYNYNERKFETHTGTGDIFISKGIFQLDNTKDQIATSYLEMQRSIGAFGELVLEYKNYAFLTFTGRNDWSSTLPKANRSFFYPSVSGSLVFTDALHIESPILSNGKIRASWAKVGNDAIPYKSGGVYVNNFANSPYVGAYRFTGFPFHGVNMQTRDNEAIDPNLEPEFTEELELGTELSFLRGRVNLDLTWYDRRSTNQLASIALGPESGYTSYYTNFGEMKNTGVEVTLDVTPVQLRDFRWNIFATFTKNKNEVLALTDGVDEMNVRNLYGGSIHSYIKVGQPYGVFYGPAAARDKEGNILINPKSGMMIEALETKKIGDPNPDYMLGLTNTFSYKGVSLNIVTDLKKGGDLYSSTVPKLLGRGVTKDTEDRERTHVIPGVLGNPDTRQPILDNDGKTIPNQVQISTAELYFSDGLGVYAFEEFKVFDATVFRLREISLGYDIPKQIVEKVGLGSASIALTGRNLWFFAPHFPEHTNFDPEVNSFGSTNQQGLEYGAAPSSRRYGINLKFTF